MPSSDVLNTLRVISVKLYPTLLFNWKIIFNSNETDAADARNGLSDWILKVNLLNLF